jgi:outer membrane protein assembly factor BamB
MEHAARRNIVLARTLFPLAIAAGVVLIATAARADVVRTLLWSDHFRTAEGTELVNAVDAQAARVFAAGGTRNADGQNSVLVRAYHAESGALLWQHEKPSNAFATAIVARGRTVFVAGGSTLRAHDAETGAILWEEETESGALSIVAGIAALGDSVFIAGSIQKQAADFDFDVFVRAHDAESGALLWQDVVDGTGRDDVATAITVTAHAVIIAGWRTNAGPLPLGDEASGGDAGNSDVLVRAYDARQGSLLWEDVFDRAGGDDVATSIVVNGHRLFVGGITETFDDMGTGNLDVLVRAYDVVTGTVLWHVDFDSGPVDSVSSIAVKGRRLFVAGLTQNIAGNVDVLVQAYDTRAGAMLWVDTFDNANGDDWANAIVVTRRKVAIAGRVTDDDGNIDFVVRAYDSLSGDVLWQDKFDVGRIDEARDIAAQRGRLFAVGLGEDDAENFDWIVRGYSLR